MPFKPNVRSLVFVSCKAVALLLLSTPPLVCFLLSARTPRPFTFTFTQAPGVGEVLVVKIESLAPPLCLLGEDPTSPIETVQINVGPTSDDPSGNDSPPTPQALPGRTGMCGGGTGQGGEGGGK